MSQTDSDFRNAIALVKLSVRESLDAAYTLEDCERIKNNLLELTGLVHALDDEYLSRKTHIEWRMEQAASKSESPGSENE